MAEYTRWYRVGTAALTKNSKVVTGTGTFWLAAGLNAGDLFTVDASQFYEIDAITSNTQINLKTAYAGESTSETEYSIIRNFTASLPAQVSAQTADLLNDFRQFVDLKMQSIHGKSAYQIACDKGYVGTESEWIASLEGASAYEVAVANGYTGTESEWLDGLKAAQEWTATQSQVDGLDSRTSVLVNSASEAKNNAGLHNSIYRGKNLGTMTPEILASIRNGSYTDLWIGDYFVHDGKKDIIAAFGFGHDISGGSVLLYRATPLVTCDDYVATYNRAASGTEGEEGYIASTLSKCYPESNWYVNIRPYFIAEIEETYGASNIKTLSMIVPTGMSGCEAQGVLRVDSKAHLPQQSMMGFHFITLKKGIYTCFFNVYPELPLHRLNYKAVTGCAACAEILFNVRNPYSACVVKTFGGHGFYFSDDYEAYASVGADHGHQLCPIFVVG